MTTSDDTRGFTHRDIETNGVRLHVVVGGTGPLVVLLHGWPESWVTWRHVMGPLMRAGFTVAVPDLRGFGLSDKPSQVADYRLDNVALDIEGLVRALGFEKAHLIAHDWGGSTAWHMAQNLDDVIDRLVIMNAPHPAIFAKRMKTAEQIKASWYMFAFQLPFIPERVLGRDPRGFVRGVFKLARRPGAFDDEDEQAYVDALSQPGAWKSGLHYYRATFRQRALGIGGRSAPKKKLIDKPTLVLWGMNDRALPPGNLDGLERYVSNLEIVRIPDCSHWVQHDAPEVVVSESLRFFGVSAPRGS